MFCKLLHPCCFIYWGIPNNVLLFSTEQISIMQFYYVQDVYQKNQVKNYLVLPLKVSQPYLVDQGREQLEHSSHIAKTGADTTC